MDGPEGPWAGCLGPPGSPETIGFQRVPWRGVQKLLVFNWFWGYLETMQNQMVQKLLVSIVFEVPGNHANSKGAKTIGFHRGLRYPETCKTKGCKNYWFS